MARADVSTDYLVVGAGISGLSFADELLTRTSATITIVDRRDSPGGHWNDSYSFLKLHQPASFYGVESLDLVEYRIDQTGLNKGLGNLASGIEVQAYCRKLMNERLLPSGRVTYLPSMTYEADGTIRGLLNNKRLTVHINKKLVDASRNTNPTPSTHDRSFKVDPSVTCIPPNDLPRLASKFTHYTILGAGKTGGDSVIWLLANGVDPNRIRWIISNDLWFVNRAKIQPGPEFFDEVFNTFLEVRKSLGAAKNAMDLALRMEDTGLWMRLDRNITPNHFHAATIPVAELQELRKVRNVVRKGRVTRIEPRKLQLTGGSIQVPENSLYIDCTASALKPMPTVPVFQPGKIVIQIVRYPLLGFSSAIIAFLESLSLTEEEKNSFATPVPFSHSVEDYIVSIYNDSLNRNKWASNAQVQDWVNNSRLDGYGRTLANIKPEQAKKAASSTEMQEATAAAGKNLPRLLASVKQKTTVSQLKASL